MPSAAFEHLSPAFPQRAAWGTAQSLRKWQQDALNLYHRNAPRDFLAVATPGAGKTTFALRVARDLLERREINRIIVVAPTEHLKVQWADAASRVGIHLDPGNTARRGRSREFVGSTLTYAGVAMRPWAYENICCSSDALVILDEVHHAGDSLSWGDALREAFGYARRRLMLTGTPFRSDENPIPFVAYDELPDGTRVSRADYTYGYANALRDHVVRPVVFMNYGGPMRWRTKSGEELSANLGELLTKDLTSHAWRTALDPKGEWITAVLGAADRRLSETRRHIPDAGGLVIASNQTSARAYARVLESITGSKPTLVLSDEARSSQRIANFSSSQERWMVAVRMVSEGVDVPRLAVGVYATATQTPLFFAQAVGRFVRSRRRGELATVFLPTVPIILNHASSLEQARDHVLGRRKVADEVWAESEAELEAANRADAASDDLLGTFQAMDSAATFDHVLYNSQAYGMFADPASADEQEYLGLPGLLDAEQVGVLLAERQRRQIARREKLNRRKPEVALHQAMADRRKKLNSLVSQYARLQSVPHSHVHADLRRQCGGPPLAKATSEQVEARIQMVSRWLGWPVEVTSH
ncbi:DEAD/DEAH box helicase [Tessaracoccus sp. OH4464_COT-324]|uniref:DEAD/DEAH box helicase n=1 Tax=Tessaracoccus sp. OH4464_COT-324 TaxID=2491059 RepID=UPI000F63D0C2|nr:DEAD/DEAH box helicase [Tessaracoccus sp. OH4464_COT-324]RRD47856.1 DEAD/DEAH box helicase [Tessaracoccus sp. OH4464_COT-324]